MTDETPGEPRFEYPDEAGYPDGAGFLSQDQKVLIGEVADDPHALGIGFTMVNEDDSNSYDAIVGDTQVATLTYERKGDRLVLLNTTVWPEYRGQGIATELIRRVLDDVRKRGLKVTIQCPIVRTFIDHNPEYQDLVDPEHPGILRVV